MKEPIDKILTQYPVNDRGSLIPMLQEVQKQEGYISKDAVVKISRHLRVSRGTVYGVTTFYSQFKFNPPGRNSIRICLGTACHVQGGDFLLNALQLEIGIKPGETTEDGRFDLERVACLGCCAIAPVMMINKDIHSHMSVIRIRQVLSNYA